MDIVKFGCVMVLVVVSFASGLNHLYFYYSNKQKQDCEQAKASLKAAGKWQPGQNFLTLNDRILNKKCI